eukprot:SAG31_NODE_3905_length_3765_cov_6.684670_4_plen_185_part_00
MMMVDGRTARSWSPPRRLDIMLLLATVATLCGPAECMQADRSADSWTNDSSPMIAAATSDGALGILNATKSCSGIDSTGVTDSTVGLQNCIERAYKANQALFLAMGRYLVSDTLTAAQADGGGITPHSPTPAPVNIVPCRFRPNVLLGSTAALPRRPTIVLGAHSPGFANMSAPKNVLKITNPG